jgi:RHS repeat-associated protein
VVPVHDQDGNMTTGLLNGSGNGQFEYDGANQLIRTQSTTTSDPTRYTYDAFGRRIAKVTYPNGSSVASAATVFLYDGWNPIAEYKLDSGAWALDRTYTWGIDLSGSTQGAGGVGGLLSVTKHEAQNTSYFFPIYDGNGNIEAYLDSNGSPAAIYQYDAFGNVLTGNGKGAAIEQAHFFHRFSTKYQDAETGLLYYGYRYSHTLLGRWINRDPIQESGGVNLYGFVNSSPINIVDGDGRLPVLIGHLFKAVAQGVADATLKAITDKLTGWLQREFNSGPYILQACHSRKENPQALTSWYEFSGNGVITLDDIKRDFSKVVFAGETFAEDFVTGALLHSLKGLGKGLAAKVTAPLRASVDEVSFRESLNELQTWGLGTAFPDLSLTARQLMNASVNLLKDETGDHILEEAFVNALVENLKTAVIKETNFSIMIRNTEDNCCVESKIKLTYSLQMAGLEGLVIPVATEVPLAKYCPMANNARTACDLDPRP